MVVMWIFLALSRVSSADVLFEGYSVIRLGSTPIGFTVQRYEFDPKKKQFSSVYLIKTNETGGNLSESLKAQATSSFEPLGYQYTSKSNDSLKMIDAKFAKDTMTFTVADGKTSTTRKAKIKKGVFLSTFLGYLMLQKGIKTDTKFTYQAIAEEDGEIAQGDAIVKGQEEYRGQKVFRIQNTFKGAEFVSLVNAKGEILSTSSPSKSISTELAGSAAEATKGFTVPAESMKLLFGSVPAGKVNSIANPPVEKPSEAPPRPADAEKKSTPPKGP